MTLAQALEEFKTEFNALSATVVKYKENLNDTKNKDWKKNVESCRVKVKAALAKATDKLAKLKGALEQFKIDAGKSGKPMDDDAKRKVSSVEFVLRFSKQTLEEAGQIATTL